MVFKKKGGIIIISALFILQIILSGCSPPKLILEQNVPDQYFLSTSKIDLKAQLVIKDSLVTSSFENIRAGVSITITDTVVNGIKRMAENVFSEIKVSDDKDFLPDIDVVLIPQVPLSRVWEYDGYKKMKMSVAIKWALIDPTGKMIWFDIVKVSKLAPSTWVAPTAIKKMKGLAPEVLGEIFSTTADLLKSSTRVLAYTENRYIAQSDWESTLSKIKSYKPEVTSEDEFIKNNWSPLKLESGNIAIISCERKRNYSTYELGIITERTFKIVDTLKEEYQKCLNTNAPEDVIAVKMRKGEIEFSSFDSSVTNERATKLRTKKNLNDGFVEKTVSSSLAGTNVSIKRGTDTISYAVLCTVNFNGNLLEWVNCK